MQYEFDITKFIVKTLNWIIKFVGVYCKFHSWRNDCQVFCLINRYFFSNMISFFTFWETIHLFLILYFRLVRIFRTANVGAPTRWTFSEVRTRNQGNSRWQIDKPYSRYWWRFYCVNWYKDYLKTMSRTVFMLPGMFSFFSWSYQRIYLLWNL